MILPNIFRGAAAQILELKDDWHFWWFENESVVDSATMFILAANAANALTK
jgi:hypothetical protein